MFFNQFKLTYGPSVYDRLQVCSRISSKIVRLTCQKEFLIKCRKDSLVPVSFKVKQLVHSSLGKSVALTASVRFISAAIKLSYVKLYIFRRSLHLHLSTLLCSLSLQHRLDIIKFLHFKADSARRYLDAKFFQKLCILKQKSSCKLKKKSPVTPSWTVNLSSRSFSETELSVLDQGLNYAYGNYDVNKAKLLAAIEPALVDLTRTKKHDLRKKISTVLLSKRVAPPPPPNHLSELKVLRSLKCDTSIHISKADKGRLTVIMDNSEYNDKILELLCDTTTYEEVKKDLTPGIQRKLNLLIGSLEKEGKVNSNLAKKLKCSSSFVPEFYGLPKIHKPGSPLRPIVNYKSSPLYNLSRYLSDLLKPLTGMSTFSIKSAYDFLDELKCFLFPLNSVMASFDVVSLFTSIPTELAIDAVQKAYLGSDFQFELDIDTVVILLRFCLTSNCFKFKNRFFRQVNGTIMGSPVSVRVSEIVMQHLENQINLQYVNDIFLWKRYVDDCFLVLKSDKLNDVLSYANSLCSDIQFTVENEVDQKLPFLDIMIERNPDLMFQSIITSVFRKSTFSGQYLNFNSANPIHHKLAVVRTLVHRAKKYCNKPHLLKEELNRIYSDLKNNNYPPRWIKRVFSRFLSTNSCSPLPTPAQRSYKYLSIPYYKGVSEKIANILKDINFKTAFKPLRKIENLVSKSEYKIPPSERNGSVYCIRCHDCNATYIGETMRNVKIRIQEHKYAFKKGDLKSKFVLHSLETDHLPDFDNVEVLTTNCSNYHSRIFLEGWYTRQQPFALNEACVVAPEYVIHI